MKKTESKQNIMPIIVFVQFQPLSLKIYQMTFQKLTKLKSILLYSNAAKLAFQSRRFWEQDHSIFGGISWTNQDITQIWYPSNALGSSRGIIVGAYIWGNSASTNFSNQSPQQRINSALLQKQFAF